MSRLLISRTVRSPARARRSALLQEREQRFERAEHLASLGAHVFHAGPPIFGLTAVPPQAEHVRGKRNNLRTALYDLRREAHADAWLERDGDRLRLLGTSDLATFEHLVNTGDLAGALDLWRSAGTAEGARTGLLEGFELSSAPTFQDWLEIERTRVAALYLDCLSLRST
jgi:hypothetical protein